jgi:hypothetical protein
MSGVSKRASAALISATAAVTLFWAAASAADRHKQEEDSSGQFDIPLEALTRAHVGRDARGTIRLPLYKGAVKTRGGLRPAWYIITDASTESEADRLGVPTQPALAKRVGSR